MSVIYATPGCSASSTLNYKCSPPSNVQYSTGSTTGTTTSTQNSFKTGVSLTATATLDPTHFILPLSGVSATAGYTVTSVQGNSTTVSKTASNTISWSPLSKDGIWHDFDIFQTVVNPAVMLRNWLDPVTLQTHVEWELGIPASDGVAFTYDSAVISVRCALAGYSNLTIAPSAGYPCASPKLCMLAESLTWRRTCAARFSLDTSSTPTRNVLQGFTTRTPVSRFRRRWPHSSLH